MSSAIEFFDFQPFGICGQAIENRVMYLQLFVVEDIHESGKASEVSLRLELY